MPRIGSDVRLAPSCFYALWLQRTASVGEIFKEPTANPTMSKLLGYLPPPLPLLIDVLNLKNPVNAVLLALVVILTLRILLPPPPYVPTPYGLADNPNEAYNWRPRRHPESQLWRTWTPQELQKYDGTDPNHEGGKILFAIRRKVYDVTAGKSFYGPGACASLLPAAASQPSPRLFTDPRSVSLRRTVCHVRRSRRLARTRQAIVRSRHALAARPTHRQPLGLDRERVEKLEGLGE